MNQFFQCTYCNLSSWIPEFFVKPLPLITPLVFVLLFFWRCYWVKKWPDVKALVELIAYSNTIYFMVLLVPKAFKICTDETNMAIGLITGVIVTTYVSIQGLWKILPSPPKRSKMTAKK